MKFKIFKAGEFTENDYNEFISNNIIVKDKFLENGDIYVFYKTIDKVGIDFMDSIEQLDRSVSLTQKEILAARLDIVSSNTELAEITEKTKDLHPNDKAQWDPVQKRRKEVENQIIMSEKTIEGRNLQLKSLMELHAEMLAEHESKNG